MNCYQKLIGRYERWLLVRPETNQVFAQAGFALRGGPLALWEFLLQFPVNIGETKKLLGPPFKRGTP